MRCKSTFKVSSFGVYIQVRIVVQALLKGQVAVARLTVARHPLLVTGVIDVAKSGGYNVPVDLAFKVLGEALKKAFLQTQTCRHTAVDVDQPFGDVRAEQVAERFKSSFVVVAAL